jgi:hypothetical protein
VFIKPAFANRNPTAPVVPFQLIEDSQNNGGAKTKGAFYCELDSKTKKAYVSMALLVLNPKDSFVPQLMYRNGTRNPELKPSIVPRPKIVIYGPGSWGSGGNALSLDNSSVFQYFIAPKVLFASFEVKNVQPGSTIDLTAFIVYRDSTAKYILYQDYIVALGTDYNPSVICQAGQKRQQFVKEAISQSSDTRFNKFLNDYGFVVLPAVIISLPVAIPAAGAYATGQEAGTTLGAVGGWIIQNWAQSY